MRSNLYCSERADHATVSGDRLVRRVAECRRWADKKTTLQTHMKRRFITFAKNSGTRILITIVLVTLTIPVSGQIYVASSAGGYVGEYTTSGATVNASLISGLGYPWGMTWDGNANLYVAQEGSRTVGKYNLSGGIVNSSLISVPGDPMGVALDGAGHVFVYDGLLNTVGEYTTSGATINSSLITGIPGGGFASIACDGNGHLFVANSGSSRIAEYTTSGTLLNASLISASDVYAMTCDGNGHLFLTRDGFIGEYTTSGATVNATLVSGLDPREFGIALDGSGHIFVSNFSAGTIGEYTTSGTTVNNALVSGLYEPMGLAVIPEPSSLGLVVLGTALLIWGRKRSKAAFNC